MASEVDIANGALIALGKDTISSLAENKEIQSQFAIVRDAVLAAHPWNFAKERASLAADPTAPDFGFARRFQIPANPLCLRVWKLDPDSHGDAKWVREGQNILTDEAAPLNIEYISQVTATGLFAPLFVTAFSAFLAWRVGPRLQASRTKIRDVKRDFDDILRLARGVDGQEGTGELPFADDFVASRA